MVLNKTWIELPEKTLILTAENILSDRAEPLCAGNDLAVVRDGLLVFLDDVLLTEAVLGSADLRARVCTDAIGRQSTWTGRQEK